MTRWTAAVGLTTVVVLVIGGFLMKKPRDALIAEGLADLEHALGRAVEVVRPTAPPERENSPWPCRTERQSAFSVDIDLKSADPRAAVTAPLAFWRKERLRVEADRPADPDRPWAVVGGRLIEISIHGFPDRGTVWIGGNTICLNGEVPGAWRSVL
ncbi:hypothetical protein FDA94_06160 [Herbidospora galbida]|uniref:Uncharacterized protein n=1 Tax=Herbidospora galbida TaxID=2575442 RepID=A0A4U3MPA7_9ACTN|nr:hypothetical protein [Herbidospora galbida]TKK90572.1 hypothetical protein FDA94_06160 [Herbidospora galbida]